MYHSATPHTPMRRQSVLLNKAPHPTSTKDFLDAEQGLSDSWSELPGRGSHSLSPERGPSHISKCPLGRTVSLLGCGPGQGWV